MRARRGAPGRRRPRCAVEGACRARAAHTVSGVRMGDTHVVRASHTAAAPPPRTASKRTDSCSALAAQWGEVATFALWRLAVHGVYGAAAGSLQTALGVLPIDISDITLRAGKARDDGDGFGTGVGVDDPPVTGEVGGSGGLHGAPGDGTGQPGSAAGGGGPAGGPAGEQR